SVPTWEAITVHVPAPTIVIVLPLVPVARQTPIGLALNVIGSPELLVALTMKGGSPKVLLASAPKAIGWLCPLIVSAGPLAEEGWYRLSVTSPIAGIVPLK